MVQVKVVADGEEQVVLQTNVEIMRCDSSEKDAERLEGRERMGEADTPRLPFLGMNAPRLRDSWTAVTKGQLAVLSQRI